MCDAAADRFYPALWALDERLWPFQGKVASVQDLVHPSKDFYAVALQRAMQELTGLTAPSEQWGCFFSADDIVGIKVNCKLGPSHCTSPILVNAIVDCLIALGIHPGKIIVWDRSNEDLKACGYTLSNAGGAVRCLGVGDIFDTRIEECGDVAGRLSMIVSRMCTAMISVPVLRHHPVDGVDGCVRNLCAALQNPHKVNATVLKTSTAEFLALESLRASWRLGICDGMFAQYSAGARSQEGAIALAADPVALDRHCLRQIAELRQANNLQQGAAPWFGAAEDMGL